MSKKKKMKKLEATLANVVKMQSYYTGSAYDSANNTYARGNLNTIYPVDSKYELDDLTLSELKNKSRYLEKNIGLIRGVLSDYDVYGVGDGIMPNPKTGDSKWDRAADAFFTLWASKCDISERFSFSEVQSIVLRALIVDGEIFVIKTYDKRGFPSMQLIESHRLEYSLFDAEKRTICGIEFDDNFKPLYYNFSTGFEDEKIKRVPASAVLHIYKPERCSQLRGYPHIQHSYNNLKDLAEIVALEKLKVKANSDIVYSLTGGATIDDTGISLGKKKNKGTSQEDAMRITGGRVLKLEEGEELKPNATSNIPNSTFMGFVEALLRFSTQGVLPYEFADNPTKIGGASVRLITSKADRYINSKTKVLDNRLNLPIWVFVIGWAITNKFLKPNNWWFYCKWTHPRKISVDAGREAQQNRADVFAGLKTIGEDYQERGLDFEDESIAKANEIAFLMQLSKETGVPFDLLYRPEGTQTIQTQKEEKKEDEDDKK